MASATVFVTEAFAGLVGSPHQRSLYPVTLCCEVCDATLDFPVRNSSLIRQVRSIPENGVPRHHIVVIGFPMVPLCLCRESAGFLGKHHGVLFIKQVMQSPDFTPSSVEGREEVGDVLSGVGDEAEVGRVIPYRFV
jgi:hypothetical protein